MEAKYMPLAVIYILISILIVVAGFTPVNVATKAAYEVWKHVMLTWFIMLPILTAVFLSIKVFQKEKPYVLDSK